MDLKNISDEELWGRTKALALQERQVTIEVIRHLREIDSRRLHFDRGYPSLYEYAVRELKFSEGAAYRRVQAMRLLQDIPDAEKKIEDGSLSLNTIAKVQGACRKDSSLKKEQLLEQLQGKPAREVDRQLAPTQALNREHTRWITSESVEISLFLDKGSFQNLNELKALKSHVPEKSTYSGVVKELIDLGQDKWNPARRRAPLTQRSSAASADARHIPSSLRAEIWKRDGSRCSFTFPGTGQRCNSNHFLQVDHIQPVALGGKSTTENLRLLCSKHNQRRAEKTFRDSRASYEEKESRLECSPDLSST